MGRPQATQGLLGKCCLLPLNPRGVAVIRRLSRGSRSCMFDHQHKPLQAVRKYWCSVWLLPERSYFERQVSGCADPVLPPFLPFEQDTFMKLSPLLLALGIAFAAGAQAEVAKPPPPAPLKNFGELISKWAQSDKKPDPFGPSVSKQARERTAVRKLEREGDALSYPGDPSGCSTGQSAVLESVDEDCPFYK